MAKLFESVQVADRPTSQFNGNCTVMHTQRMSELMPMKVYNFYPGDKFYGKMGSVFNFPPLLTPAYQRFSLKQYAFRIRKALTWNSDAMGKYLTSMSDGKPAPSQPYIQGDDMYFFGTGVAGLRFCPQLPVYGVIDANGQVHLQKDNLPNFLTFNHLYFGAIPDGVNIDLLSRALVANWFKFDIKDFEQDPWKLPKYDKFLNIYYDQGSQSFDFDVYGDEVTFNHVKFEHIGSNGDFSERFSVKPLCYEGSLLEGLGYPTSGVRRLNLIDYYDPTKYDQKTDNLYQTLFNQIIDSFYDSMMRYIRLGDNGTFTLTYFSDDDAVNGALNVNYNRSFTGSANIKYYLMMYAIWAITHGHGDGSVPLDFECPMLHMWYLKDLFYRPRLTEHKDYKFDAGRLTAYWLVYDEYFRDASLSDPLNFEPVRLSNANWFRSCHTMHTDSRFHTEEGIMSDNSDVYERFGIMSYYKAPLGKRNPVTEELVNMFYSNVPYKLLDKDWYSSVMPWTTRIEVFAPAISSSNLQSSATDIQGTENSISRVTPNQFTPNTGNLGGDTDFSPRAVDDPIVSAFSNSFVSVDAFRTAELLQQFFRDASLCGNKPVTWVLVNFGVHSADFRHEVPTLVDINESPISITELTQSSETEQLPIGSEAGKMYCTNNGLNINVDSVGECGYLIFMSCVYPETDLVNGLNPEIEALNPWNQMFLPQFAQLGEEAIPRKYFKYDCSYQGIGDLETEYGFSPRFSRFKQQISEVHGRFNTDMKHWHLQRMATPLSGMPNLNQQNIESPIDLRLFASDEIANCYGITYFKVQFERKLTPKVYTQLT